MERKCSNCVYVHSIAESNGIHYECRRYPPTPVVVVGLNTHIRYEWSAVKWNAWCGEFKDASQPDEVIA